MNRLPWPLVKTVFLPEPLLIKIPFTRKLLYHAFNYIGKGVNFTAHKFYGLDKITHVLFLVRLSAR